MNRRGVSDVRGLSLLEVIVLIVLILIVASMFLPVVNPCREDARAAVCKSNLKNIGLCADMYSQDYRGEWPAFHSGDSPRNARDADELSILWDTFITDAALLYCPSIYPEVETGVDTSLGVPIVLDISYCYIGNGSANDERLSGLWVAGDWWGVGKKGKAFASNHDTGANMLHGDGHVEWVASGGGVRVERTRPTGEFRAADKDLWRPDATKSILYGPNGTIDDIPENR